MLINQLQKSAYLPLCHRRREEWRKKIVSAPTFAFHITPAKLAKPERYIFSFNGNILWESKWRQAVAERHLWLVNREFIEAFSNVLALHRSRISPGPRKASELLKRLYGRQCESSAMKYEHPERTPEIPASLCDMTTSVERLKSPLLAHLLIFHSISNR